MHRDLKPDNIFVSNVKTIVILRAIIKLVILEAALTMSLKNM